MLRKAHSSVDLLSSENTAVRTRLTSYGNRTSKRLQSPIANFSNQKLEGTFPYVSLDMRSWLTDVDLSNNFLNNIDIAAVLHQLPALRRLNLANNLFGSLGAIAALGALPALEALDLRGNLCGPGGGRGELLAALLVPHGPSFAAHQNYTPADVNLAREQVPAILEQAAATLLEAGQLQDLTGALGPESPKKLRPSKPDYQERVYRDTHLDGGELVVEAEAAARERLRQLRKEASCKGKQHQEKSSWQPRHLELIMRRVGSCHLPRAHLLEVPLGTGWHDAGKTPQGGAGVPDHFPKLIELDGQPITIQDLEEALMALEQRLPLRGCMPVVPLANAGLHREEPKGAALQKRPHSAGRIQDPGTRPSPKQSPQRPKPPPKGLKPPLKAPELGVTEPPQDASPAPKLDVQRRRSENYHGYLVRVRTEFSQNKKWVAKRQKKKRFYSSEFEEWRRKPREEEASDSNDDVDAYFAANEGIKSIAPPMLAALATRRFKNRVKHSKKEDLVLQALEVNMWELIRSGKMVEGLTMEEVRKCVLSTCSSSSASSASSASDDSESSRDYENWWEGSPEDQKYGQEKDAAAAAAELAELAAAWHTTCERVRAVGIPCWVLDTVPLNHQAAKGQARRLDRVYKSASATELSQAATQAAAGADVFPKAKGAAGGRRRHGGKETKEPVPDPRPDRYTRLVSHLKQWGLTQGLNFTGGEAGKRQWMVQLAEDYPDEFCRRISGEEYDPSHVPPVEPLEKIVAVGDRRKEALVSSPMWVLASHGNPLEEKDWQRRTAWLSKAGRVWLDIEGGGCSLMFGGELASNLMMGRARQGVEAVSVLRAKRVHVIRVDGPGARFPRKHYMATEDDDTCERWLMLCRIVQTGKKEVTPGHAKEIGSTPSTPSKASRCGSLRRLSTPVVGTQSLGFLHELESAPASPMSGSSASCGKLLGHDRVGTPSLLIKQRRGSSPALSMAGSISGALRAAGGSRPPSATNKPRMRSKGLTDTSVT